MFSNQSDVVETKTSVWTSIARVSENRNLFSKIFRFLEYTLDMFEYLSSYFSVLSVYLERNLLCLLRCFLGRFHHDDALFSLDR